MNDPSDFDAGDLESLMRGGVGMSFARTSLSELKRARAERIEILTRIVELELPVELVVLVVSGRLPFERLGLLVELDDVLAVVEPEGACHFAVDTAVFEPVVE